MPEASEINSVITTKGERHKPDAVVEAEIRRENLELSEANRVLTSKLAKAEQEAREAREQADRREAQMRRDRDAAERRAEVAERRAIAAETRLAEVLAANDHDPDPPDNPPSSLTMAIDNHEDIGEPLLPLAVCDDPAPNPPKKKRGRPAGSKNKPRNSDCEPPPPRKSLCRFGDNYPTGTGATTTYSSAPGPIEPTVVDDTVGFEELNEDKCLEHFGIQYAEPPCAVPPTLAVRSLLLDKIGTRDINAWIKAGYVRKLNDQTLFNIAKTREAVDDAKAQLSQAKAEGFKIAEPTAYGAANHGEAHDLMLKALGLQRVVDGLKPLLDGGYLRIIGGMRLYQVERMRALMEKGRAAQKPHDTQPNPEQQPAPDQPGARDRDLLLHVKIGDFEWTIGRH